MGHSGAAGGAGTRARGHEGTRARGRESHTPVGCRPSGLGARGGARPVETNTPARARVPRPSAANADGAPAEVNWRESTGKSQLARVNWQESTGKSHVPAGRTPPPPPRRERTRTPAGRAALRGLQANGHSTPLLRGLQANGHSTPLPHSRRRPPRRPVRSVGVVIGQVVSTLSAPLLDMPKL